jgi:dephospho-CoA kinase
VFLIALTGGIASGKSTVAKRLVELGAHEIDADQVAREVVLPGTQGLKTIQEVFGDTVLDGNGSLDRERLGHIVFNDPDLRTKLEEILHPLIRARTAELISQSKAEIVVYSVPLLVESGVNHNFDLVITVEAGVENQIQRLVESRGLSEQQARQRIAAQASAEQRRAMSDYVIDSSGSKEQTKNQVADIWASVLELAARKESRGSH